jgi:hypothetical protein
MLVLKETPVIKNKTPREKEVRKPGRQTDNTVII